MGNCLALQIFASDIFSWCFCCKKYTKDDRDYKNWKFILNGIEYTNTMCSKCFILKRNTRICI